MGVDFVVAEDAEGAALEAARRLAEVARRGGAVALAGGSTPRRAYELAASLEPDWGRVDVWLGDERCVPPDDVRSNLRLVRESLLERLERPPVAPPRPRPSSHRRTPRPRTRKGRVGRRSSWCCSGSARTATRPRCSPSPVARRAARARGRRTGRARALGRARDADDPGALRRARGRLPRRRAGQGRGRAARVRRAALPETPASLVRATSGRTTAILDRAAAGRLPDPASLHTRALAEARALDRTHGSG